MTQTRDGYLWLGTQNGLARFDGLRFRVWTKANAAGLGNSYVQALAEDKQGRLWIGTAGGGLSYREHEKIEPFEDRAHLGGDTVYALLAASNGKLWVGTENGLSVIEDGRVRLVGHVKGPVYSIVETKDGSVWFGTYGQGLGQIGSDGRLRRWTQAEGLADNRVVFLQRAGGDGVWVACYGGWVQRWSESGFESIPKDPAGKNRGIWAILEDRRGRTWLGSFGAGLGEVRPGRGMVFEAGFDTEAVWSLLEDREGNIWAGTAEGLYQFRPLPLRTYGREDGLAENMVSSVWQDSRGTMWVGTTGGLNAWGGGRKVVLRQQVMSALEDKDGTVWLGTAEQGLWQMQRDGTGSRLMPGPWSTLPIHALARAEDGGLMVGTFGAGLFRCGARMECMPVKEVESKRVIAIQPGRGGRLWVATRDGLMVQENARWRRLTVADGLGSNLVTAVKEDADGTVWIGTEGGGLARMRAGRIEKVGVSQGLPSELVYSIADDGQGRLWMGSPVGIFSMEKASFGPGLKVMHYGAQDGMRVAQCFADTAQAVARTSDGVLWFATMKGLVRVDPRRLAANPVAPPVVIEEVRVDGVAIAAGREGFDIAPGRYRVEIQYTGLSLTAPERQRFRYQLEGYEPQWVEAGTSRSAVYTNLKPGRHRFRVVGANADGVWNPQAAELDLNWQPKWTETWWFAWLTGIALAGIAVAAYRYRLRQIAARHEAVLEERMRIAREIHDTYLQGFLGVTMQLNALRILHGSEDSVLGQKLDGITGQAMGCLKEGREAVGNLRLLGAGEGEGLSDEIRSTLEAMLLEGMIEFSLSKKGSFRKVSGPVRQAVVQILREGAQNVLRHSRARRVEVAVVGEDQGCTVTLKDDGMGFDVNANWVESGHFGLAGMAERARAVQGRMTVASEPGAGTTLTIWMPWSGH